MFSCVIPVKGARPYMAEAVESLRRQGMGDELEIIVQDGDVEADGGQSEALNKGFAKAKGEWLFWLNADDILLPDAISRVCAIVAKHESRVNWIVGNQLLIDACGKVIKCSVGNVWHDWLYHNAVPHVYGPSSFFRRELFNQVGRLDVNLHYCMDWDLWIKFMKEGARFTRLTDYLWAQRQWSGSKTQRNVSAAESILHWNEINSMLARNGVEMTWAGLAKFRLWRVLNGNYAKEWFDTLRLKGSFVR